MQFRAWDKLNVSHTVEFSAPWSRDTSRLRDVCRRKAATQLRVPLDRIDLVRLDEPHVNTEAIDAFVQDMERATFGVVAMVA